VDPLGGLLLSGASSRPRFVIVNGRVVVEEGRIPGFDERAQAARHNAAAAELLARARPRAAGRLRRMAAPLRIGIIGDGIRP